MSEPSKSQMRRLERQKEDCDWCGRKVKPPEKLRWIKYGANLFIVCDKCPPPDNANAMRV